MNRGTLRSIRSLSFALLVGLAACSLTKLAYNHLDWMVLERVDDFVSLDEEQRRRLITSLARVLEGHRRETLPGIAGWLDRAASHLRSGGPREDVRALLDSAETLLKDSARALMPEIANVLAGLDARQRALLRDRVANWEREAVERHWLDRSAEARLERRIERSIERIEDVTGALSRAQSAQVAAAVATMPDTAADWLAYAHERNAVLLARIDGGADRDELESLLTRRFVELQDIPGGLNERWRAKLEMWVSLLHALARSLDPEQRRHAVAFVEELREDALALVAKGS